MSAIPRRILFALLAMLACVLFAIIVVGGAAVVLILLSIASIVAPLAILFVGPGPLNGRIRVTRRRRDRSDEAIDI